MKHPFRSQLHLYFLPQSDSLSSCPEWHRPGADERHSPWQSSAWPHKLEVSSALRWTWLQKWWRFWDLEAVDFQARALFFCQCWLQPRERKSENYLCEFRRIEGEGRPVTRLCQGRVKRPLLQWQGSRAQGGQAFLRGHESSLEGKSPFYDGLHDDVCLLVASCPSHSLQTWGLVFLHVSLLPFFPPHFPPSHVA